MPSGALTDPGIISLNKSGSVFATHYSDDLFVDDGMGNMVLAIPEGNVTLSDGFFGSLATYIDTHPTAMIELASGAKMEIIANADDLIALGDALVGKGLSFTDFFPGNGDLKILVDEDNPVKLAELGERFGSDFLDITSLKISTGGTHNLVVSFYDDSLDYSVYDNIVLIGNNDQIEDFVDPSGPYNVSSTTLALIDEYVVSSGTIRYSVAEFTATNPVAFTLVGTENDDAKVKIRDDVTNVQNSTFGADLTARVTESAYGSVVIEVEDEADTINGASIGSNLHGFQTAFTHIVRDNLDNVKLTDDAEDWIDIYPSAFVQGETLTIPGNFEADNDVVDISDETSIYTWFPDDSDNFDRDLDFSFIAAGQSFNDHDFNGVNDLERVDIRITGASLTFEFDGLLDTGSSYDGTVDYTVTFPATPAATADDIDVFNLYGVPAIDELTEDDFNDLTLIPDSEIFRFWSLTLHAQSTTLWDLIFSIAEDTSSYREDLVSYGISTDGLFQRQFDFLENIDNNFIFNVADDPSPDLQIGDGGNDTLSGGGGNDTLVGGLGDDSIDGGDGNDFLVGLFDGIYLGSGTDNDTINGGGGDDYIVAGEGDDEIYGEDGFDNIRGGEGNDTIDGGADRDNLDGRSGNDSIFGGGDDDTIYGADGDDSIDGGTGNDYLNGDDDNDTIQGSDGSDTINGGYGNDTIDGGTDNDNIYGGDGDDEIYGQAGLEYISGEGGNDSIDGGADSDDIHGGDGDDTITGGTGNDDIRRRW